MRKLIPLLALLLAGLTLSAQKFGGSAYAGMTASQLNGDGLGGFDLPGARLGVATYLKASNSLKISLELAFLQKGSRDVPSDSSTFYKARLNMVELPLMFEYNIGDLAFEAGPALDILVSSREESNGFELNSDPPFENISLAAIAGVSYYFGPRWHINFRVNHSITSVRTNEVPYNPAIPRRLGGNGWRNLNLSFAIYYDFTKSN